MLYPYEDSQVEYERGKNRAITVYRLTFIYNKKIYVNLVNLQKKMSLSFDPRKNLFKKENNYYGLFCEEIQQIRYMCASETKEQENSKHESHVKKRLFLVCPKEINGLLVRNLESWCLFWQASGLSLSGDTNNFQQEPLLPSDNSQDIDILYPSPFT